MWAWKWRSATWKLLCWFWSSHALEPHHLSILQVDVSYENLLSIVFILPYNTLRSLMNTEWLWKLSTSFIFKGLDSLECQEFLCWKSHLSTPNAEGFLLQFPSLPRSEKHATFHHQRDLSGPAASPPLPAFGPCWCESLTVPTAGFKWALLCRCHPARKQVR